MDFEQIVRWYFAGEKAEALWILAAGIVSLVCAIVLWFVAREPCAVRRRGRFAHPAGRQELRTVPDWLRRGRVRIRTIPTWQAAGFRLMMRCINSGD